MHALTDAGLANDDSNRGPWISAKYDGQALVNNTKLCILVVYWIVSN